MKIFKLTILSIFTLITLIYLCIVYTFIYGAKNNSQHNNEYVEQTKGIIYDISDKSSNQISNEILSILNIKSNEGQTIEDFVNAIGMPLITQGNGINDNDMFNNMILLSEEQLNTDRYTKIYISIQQANMDSSISGGQVNEMSLFIKDYNRSTEIFGLLSSYIEDNSDFYTSETDGTTWTCEGFIYDKDDANNIDLVNQGEDFKGVGSLTGNNTKLTLSKSSNGFEIIIKVIDDRYDWPPNKYNGGVLP